MAKILISRKQCQIVEEDDLDFIDQLRRELSFFVQGAEHSKKYRGFIDKNTGKQITWDGHKYLISKTLKFSPGLLHRVQRFYDIKNRIVETIDLRPKIEPTNSVDILPALLSLGKNPYYYQIDTANLATQNERGIIRAATGSGKSIIAALITAKLGKSAVIYVIGKDLLYQIHGLFSALFEEKIGIIGDGKCEVADINVATIWTVGQALGLRKTKAEDEDNEKKVPPEKYKEIRNMLAYSRAHIFDECHLAACDTIQGICKAMNPENIYGMSASPWRDDGSDLLVENFLGNVIVDIPARKLIEEGYLVPPLIRFLTVPPNYKRNSYKKVYQYYITNNETRNQMIVTGAQKLVEQGFQTLVLFHSLNHGKILYDKLSQNMSCALLSGKNDSKTRIKVKEDLEAGKINCIVASKIFDIGVDLPSLSGLIVAGGGKSSVRALQRVGRVIRKHPKKSRAAVIDFADQAPYLLNHSENRRNIYSQEFDVKWPGT